MVERVSRSAPKTGSVGPAAEAREWMRQLLEPSVGRLGGLEEAEPSPDGRHIAFVAAIRPDLQAPPLRRVHVVDRDTGAVSAVGAGRDDRCPRWSADGRLAYVTDLRPGRRLQPVLCAADLTGPETGFEVSGIVETLEWSPDGGRLLLCVADAGADVAGGHGSGTLGDAVEDPGAPVVESGSTDRRRRAVLLDVATATCRTVSPPELNVWEAAWCGDDGLLAVTSARADEGGWYRAELVGIDCGDQGTADAHTVFRSSDQLGCPRCSPDGRWQSFIQAVASDRGFVQGELMLVGPDGGASAVDVRGVDVTDTAWRADGRLNYAGIRGMDSVVGELDPSSGEVTEIWSTSESLGGGKLPRVRAGRDGAHVTVRESYARSPEIISIGADGPPRTRLATAHPGAAAGGLPHGTIEPVHWTAPDGLTIHGLFARPAGDGPFPLVVHLHGGPVGAARDRWLMGDPYLAALLARGYAILRPNPRGSSGRGREFASLVRGDMNGADTHDVLSGIDSLVTTGLADAERIGVMGGSYGGNLTAWLVTQDDRFAAAIPLFTHSDFVSFHYTTNIPEFDEIFLAGDPLDPSGPHMARSSFRFAARVRTPVLQIAGGLDRCCPPSQAQLFHRALRAHGVESELVTYPREGHGIRATGALIDSTARIVEWFERHMPSAAVAPAPR
jgi:dipeptidyl aminopeptidase/acylaminoacyl peptidase